MVISTKDEMVSFYQRKGLPIPKEEDLQILATSVDSLKKQISSDSKQARMMVPTMVNLLSITKRNMELLNSQGWVSSLWNTLTGHSASLKDKNVENLLKVQYGVYFCLNLLEKENALFRQVLSPHLKAIKEFEHNAKQYHEHVHGYSEEVLTKEQKELLVFLLMHLAQIDGELSPQEDLLIKNKMVRLGLDFPCHKIFQLGDLHSFLAKLREYDKMSQIIIYKNLVELVHCDKNKEAVKEEELSSFKPYFKLEEHDLTKIEKDVREYIMDNEDPYVYLPSRDKRIKICPEDFKLPSYRTRFTQLGIIGGEEDKPDISFAESLNTPFADEVRNSVANSVTPESLMKLGEECLEKEKYEEARGYFERVIELDPQNARAYTRLGYCLCCLLEVEEEEQKAAELLNKSIKLLNKSIELDPSNTEAHFCLGTIFCSLGEYGMAVEHTREALKIKPDFLEAHELNINILKESDDVSMNIIEEYHHILEKNPRDPHIHWGLGVAYFESWEAEKAVKYIKKAISLKPDFYEAYLSLGQVYLDWWSADYKKAASALEKAVKLKPERGEAHYYLGRAYHKCKFHKKAVDVYRKLKDLDHELAQKLSKEIKGSIGKVLK